MESSAQNSSGVHWCRRRVRFSEVSEKVPKVPEKVWEVFGAEPGHVQQGSGEGSEEGSGEGSEALVQSQVRFNRVPEKVPEKVPEVGEALVQNQVRFNREKVPEKEFRRRSGGFGAEPGQVQQGSREGSVEGSGRLCCRARSGSTGFRRRSSGVPDNGFQSWSVDLEKIPKLVSRVSFRIESSHVV